MALIGNALSAVTGVIKSAGQSLLGNNNYPSAIYRLTVDGNDIAQLISPRLISLSLTDNRGIEADQLSIELSDHDGLLNIPPRGAVIQLWLGWSDTGLVDKGTYTVTETEHSGAPDVLSIRASSANLGNTLKTKREHSWSNTTLGAVIFRIAAANGLEWEVHPELIHQTITQLDQANESDANLLTRLGQQFDATTTVKAGCLLCIPAGRSQTATGKSLPHITITRAEGDSHRFLQADRDAYTGVRAYYYDIDGAEKKQAIAGAEENLKDLRHTYSDKHSALRAARSELKRIERGSATLSYTLAKARPELIPELTYSLIGVKAEIDAIIWHGSNVAHSLTADGGYSMSLEFERHLPEN